MNTAIPKAVRPAVGFAGKSQLLQAGLSLFAQYQVIHLQCLVSILAKRNFTVESKDNQVVEMLSYMATHPSDRIRYEYQMFGNSLGEQDLKIILDVFGYAFSFEH